jgi:hypothetical protein
MYPRPHSTRSQYTPYVKAWGPGLNKGGDTVRPSGASPSPGLAKTSALAHTWIQKGSIPQLTSWRSVISLSTHDHVHITFSFYIPCRANPILSCLPNPQIWSRGLRSPTAVPAGASRSHILITHPFSEALLDTMGYQARNRTPVPP